jgi:hypothetical protein
MLDPEFQTGDAIYNQNIEEMAVLCRENLTQRQTSE